ncbi:hypothetical protein ACQPUZ_04690 [Clostridium tertium]
MSKFNPIVAYGQKIEVVDFIVAERIREACSTRMYDYKKASEKCEIDLVEFGFMANGHKEVPKEYIFKLMKGFDLPRGFFYRIKWERV